MNDCFYIIKDWLELLSYIATCITALTIIGSVIGIIVYFKNRLTRKTLEVKFTVIKKYKQRLFCSIDFNNYTDKDFSIIECVLHYKGKEYIMSEKIYSTDPLFSSFVEKKNIFLIPHQSITLERMYFSIENCEATSCKFEVKTTLGNLIYSVETTEKNS